MFQLFNGGVGLASFHYSSDSNDRKIARVHAVSTAPYFLRRARIGALSVIILSLIACGPLKKATRQGTLSKPTLLTKDLTIPEKRSFPLATEVAPCDNFYQYVCKGVTSSFTLPDDQSSWTFAFNDSAERLKRKKLAYVNQLISTPATMNQQTAAIRNTYLSCMNARGRRESELKRVDSLKEELSRIGTRQGLMAWLGQRILSGRFSLVHFGQLNNILDSNKTDLYFGIDIRGLDYREQYHKPAILKDYVDLLAMFFREIHMDQPQNRAQALLDFETQFADVYPEEAKFRELIVDEKTYKDRGELLTHYPLFGLEHIFEVVRTQVAVREFSPAANELIHGWLQRAPISQIKDLILLRELWPLLRDSSPDLEQARLLFNHKHRGGPLVRPPRNELCYEEVASKFSMEIDFQVMDTYFKDFSKESFVSLLNKVRIEMLRRIETSTWLSAKGTEGAVNKMQKLRFQVVKPDQMKDWTFVPLRDYVETDDLANLETYQEAEMEFLLTQLNQEVPNRSQWEMSPLEINAYYSPPDNKFVMPQGILQYPFYDESLPLHVNMGGVGMVVGHEIGHAIDDVGSQFDGDGNKVDWMEASDRKHFKQQGQLLGKYYAASKHDPELTMGENIGDLSGLTFAYGAAFPDGAGTQQEKQEFFIQFGRSWCQIMRPELRQTRLKTDEHSQLPERVNLPLQHMDGFVEAFQCKAGDKMFLPKTERVSIW